MSRRKNTEPLKIARQAAVEYIDNKKFVETMESLRPSILSRLGISTEGYLPFAYELPDRRMPVKDGKLIQEYLDRRRKKEALEITINERLFGRQRSIASAVFIDGMKNREAAVHCDTSLSTVNRTRKNAYKELADELVTQGILSEW